jgi:hypothetical protein
MFWTLLFYLFLVLVFLVFLKLGRIRVGGKRILKWPMRFTLSIIFPLIFVIVALFGSIFLLFVMSLLLISLLLFLVMFFLGKVELFQFGPHRRYKEDEPLEREAIIEAEPVQKKKNAKK